MLVTGFHKAGYELYGERCFESLQAYWSDDIVVYAEDCLPKLLRDNVEIRHVPEEVTQFLGRHQHDPMMRGEVPYPGKSWKAKDREGRYSFRFDVVKFHKMAIYTWDAAEKLKEGLLVWIDGDVLTHKPAPRDFVGRILQGADCAYLGRDPYHSETGFVAFRLPEALPLIRQWAGYYIDRTFIEEREWHSAFLFDRAREATDVNCLNLSPGGTKHVWFQTELGDFMDHLKGKRKNLEASPERFA